MAVILSFIDCQFAVVKNLMSYFKFDLQTTTYFKNENQNLKFENLIIFLNRINVTKHCQLIIAIDKQH